MGTAPAGTSPASPTGAQEPKPAFSRRRLLAIGAAGAAAAVGLTVGGIWGYHSGKSGAEDYYQPRNNDLSAQNVSMSSQLAALQADQAKTSADAAAVPDLAAVAAKHPGMDPISPSASSLEVTYRSSDPDAKLVAVYAFMTELGFTSAVLDRMGKTRALDGTLTAQGHNCNVSWTYHPDDGLQMVFEARAS